MPKFVVGDRMFDITAEAAEPLVKADVLYWDDAGESRPKKPHLHLNPETAEFGDLEPACYERGVSALPSPEDARRLAAADPDGHPWATAA